MKRLTALFLVLVFAQISCKALIPVPPTPTAPPVPAVDPMTLPWDDRSIYADGLVPGYRPLLEKLPAASVYHLDLTLAPDMIHMQGHEEVHYTNAEDRPLKEVNFRLFPNILGGETLVSEVRVDGRPVMPSYSLRKSLLTVPLVSALEPGHSLVLAMDFTVSIPQSTDLNYGVLAYADGVLALAHAYPMIPVYNQEGWNAEIPPQSGDVTFADMSFFVVRVTAPKKLVLVAVGSELSREEKRDVQVVTYAAGPVRDFYLAASADYAPVTGQAGGTAVRFYAPASLRSGARAGLDIAIRSIEDYSQRYALFPYSEIDLVSTPTQALGIEYPGMVAITESIISPGDEYLEGVMAHEVGHQWFYNLVGSDQLDEPWLDESLAQFATLQYFTDQYGAAGETGFRQTLEERWKRVNDAPIPIGKPVADYTGEEYGAIVYGRGGLFFDALREEMGADKFDAFMKDYTATFSWGIATTDGLKSVAEKDCSCDLTPLFDEWVYP